MSRFVTFIVFAVVAVSCGDGYRRDAERTVDEYGPVNSDLQKIHDLYPEGGDRRRAAYFLLAGAAGNYTLTRGGGGAMHRAYDSISAGQLNAQKRQGQRFGNRETTSIPDAETIRADSIRYNIERAFEAWEAAPWQKDYTKADFLEYVLPYRASHEPLEYYWREDCLRRFPAPDSADMLARARAINAQIDFRGNEFFYGSELQGYTSAVRSGVGKCDDRAVLLTMAMRAAGIPSAYESIPYWGSTNNGHALCAVVLPDGRSAVFQSTADQGDNAFFVNKIPKVYRRMFSTRRDTPLWKYRDMESLPPVFADHDLIDVTAGHPFGFSDCEVAIADDLSTNKIVYLAVFSPSAWMPVAYAPKHKSKALFRAVGTGLDASGGNASPGDGVGRGILYLPCFYDNGAIVPAGAPFIHSDTGDRFLAADPSRTQTVTLSRKFPRKERIAGFAGQMTGGVFEVSDDSRFERAREVHYIAAAPASHMQRVETEPAACRYVRYRKASGAFSLGEMAFYDRSGAQLTGKPIACKALEGVADVAFASDGDPLTFLSVSGLYDPWVGVDFGRRVTIGALGFCPRTDDNDVRPGDRYELWWWDGEWTSLGVQTATDYAITWKEVPQGALLWLRNLTRGREERPFTYEEGRQVWW